MVGNAHQQIQIVYTPVKIVAELLGLLLDQVKMMLGLLLNQVKMGVCHVWLCR
jgi:hypothetical protein